MNSDSYIRHDIFSQTCHAKANSEPNGHGGEFGEKLFLPTVNWTIDVTVGSSV